MKPATDFKVPKNICTQWWIYGVLDGGDFGNLTRTEWVWAYGII